MITCACGSEWWREVREIRLLQRWIGYERPPRYRYECAQCGAAMESMWFSKPLTNRS